MPKCLSCGLTVNPAHRFCSRCGGDLKLQVVKTQREKLQSQQSALSQRISSLSAKEHHLRRGAHAASSTSSSRAPARLALPVTLPPAILDQLDRIRRQVPPWALVLGALVILALLYGVITVLASPPTGAASAVLPTVLPTVLAITPTPPAVTPRATVLATASRPTATPAATPSPTPSIIAEASATPVILPPPAISLLQVLAGATTAEVSWITDMAANSSIRWVDLRFNTSTNRSSFLLETAHYYKLEGLTSAANYSYLVTACRPRGSCTSTGGNFTTKGS